MTGLPVRPTLRAFKEPFKPVRWHREKSCFRPGVVGWATGIARTSDAACMAMMIILNRAFQ
jgi:hypothetical protein